MIKPVYLDHMSTTPLDGRVRAAMDTVLDLGPANPHAVTHAYGWEASRVLDAARAEVAAMIGAATGEIVFTSGATEANNLAIAGALRASGKSGLVISAIEHPCVLEAARSLERDGFMVTRVPVDENATVDPVNVAAAIDNNTGLVSIMLANNETATVQPVAEIGALCRELGVAFHTDAVQAAGRIPVAVHTLKVDLLSLSAHKVYGPMGIGALYVRSGTPVERQMHGGGQQGGVRSGTVPTALVAGFGAAASLAVDQLPDDAGHLTDLSELLWRLLKTGLPELSLIAEDALRLPGCLNVCHRGIDARDWLLATPGVAASTGAACASADGRPSHVLRATGLGAEDAAGAVRLSVGRSTSRDDIDRAAADLIMAANKQLGAGGQRPGAAVSSPVSQ